MHFFEIAILAYTFISFIFPFEFISMYFVGFTFVFQSFPVTQYLLYWFLLKENKPNQKPLTDT